MGIDYQIYIKTFSCLPGTSESEIRRCEQALKHRLPEEYVGFMRVTNGGEGFIGEGYAAFFNLNELPLVNTDYQVEEFAPGLVIFASNGGGECFGFDTRDEQWPIVQVPSIGMEWKYAWPIGRSFSEFLQLLYEVK
jgi:hypothetical protein